MPDSRMPATPLALVRLTATARTIYTLRNAPLNSTPDENPRMRSQKDLLAAAIAAVLTIIAVVIFSSLAERLAPAFFASTNAGWFVPIALSFSALSVILVIRNKRREKH
jgi:hypothetical protein